MADPRERDLTTGPVGEHIRSLAVPAALSLLFLTLYNVTDTVYAGQVSTQAQAGLGLGGQVFFIVPAIGVGFRIGAAAVFGRLVGSGDRERARQAAVQTLLAATIATVLTMVAGYLLLGPLVTWIADGQSYGEAARQYVNVMVLATPGFLLTYAWSGMLEAQGDAKTLAQGQLGSTLLNVALNPLFVFGIPGLWDGMGLVGIAIATVLCQNGVLAFVVWRASQTRLLGFPGPAELAVRPDLLRALFHQIAPATSRLLVIVVGGTLTQLWLRPFGDDAVAGYNVGLRLEQLLLLPAIGITGALLPFTSQNAGAGRRRRIREAFWTSTGLATGLMVAGTGLIWLLGPQLVAVFGASDQAQGHGLSYLRVESAVLPVFALLFGLQNLLQGLQRPLWPLAVGVWRQGLGVAALGAIYIVWLDLGPLGMWLTVATGVLTSTLILVVATVSILRQEQIDLRPAWAGGPPPNHEEP